MVRAVFGPRAAKATLVIERRLTNLIIEIILPENNSDGGRVKEVEARCKKRTQY